MIKLGCDESLPSGWNWVKAQDYIDVRDGTHDSPKPVEEGIPLVTSKNLVGGKIDFSTCTFISKEDHDAISKRSAVHDGDILYAMIGTIGNPVIVEKTHEFSIKNVALFKFKNAEVHNRYVFHFLNCKLAEQQLRNKSRGGTQKFVSLGNIRELEIPLPPLAEQKRIAAILDKADAIRRKRQQAIELADEFLCSVFLDMFGDPVTNPKGWVTEKLENLCGVGSSRRVFTSEFVESGVPFYRGTEVGKLGSGVDIKPDLFISDDHYSRLKDQSGVPKIGDLLLPSICHDGRIWQVDNKEPFYFKDGRVLWIKVDPGKIKSDFLQSYLKYLFLVNYSAIASGTTFAELKIIILKGLNILVPPLEIQAQFSKVFQKTIKNVNSSNAGSEKLECLFNSLSQKAFSGKL